MLSSFFQKGITFDAKSLKYHCYMCRKSMENRSSFDPEKHHDGAQHQRSHVLFQKDFTIKPKTIECKRCGDEVTWPEVERHADFHDVFPWNKPFLILYLNSVSKLPNQKYYCHLCNAELPDWPAMVAHINEADHLQLRSSNSDFKITASKAKTIPEWIFNKLVNNCITFIDAVNYKCHICKIKINRLNNATDHAESDRHRENKLTFKSSSFSVKGVVPPNRTEECKVKIPLQNGEARGSFSKLQFHVPECYEWMIVSYGLKVWPACIFCGHCKIYLKNEGAVYSHLKSHLNRPEEAALMFSRYAATLENTSPEEIETMKRSLLSIDPKVGARAKNLAQQEEKMLLAVPENLRWMLKAHDITVSKEYLYCKYCNVRMINDGSVRSHLHSHVQKVIDKLLPGNPEVPTKSDETSNGRSYVQPPPVPIPFYLLQHKNYIFNKDPEKLEDLKFCSFFTTASFGESSFCWICSTAIPSDVQGIYEHWCSHAQIRSQLKKQPSFLEEENNTSKLDLTVEYISENFSCNLCEESLGTSDKAGFEEHIRGAGHAKKKEEQRKRSEELYKKVMFHHTSNWYNIEEYYCFGCACKCFKNESDFISHVEGQKHAKRVATKIGKLTFDSCIPCGILWLGKDDLYLKHKVTEEHHEWLETTENMFDLSEEAEHLCLSLDQNIAELLAQSDRVCRMDKERENNLLRRLETTVKYRFPEGKAYSFGSRVAGLASSESDIDVFFDSGHAYNGNSNHNELVALNSVVLCLQRNGKQRWRIEDIIDNSRTPIIKVKDLLTGLKCDISFSNGLSVENTKLIKSYCEAYPPCRQMILFMKKWMSICDLSGSRKITNYAISWYVIFYLQNMGILPTVAQLIARKNQSQIISGWEAGVLYEFEANQTQRTVKELLKGFFVFYSEFNYKYDVVCPLTGETLSKLSFTSLGQLPLEMTPYFKHLQTSRGAELFRIDSAMCIQDPFDLSHNLTKAVKKPTVNRFKLLCMKSVELLVKNN